MPHRQSSLIEGRIFHYKVPFPLNFTSLKKILQKQSSGSILEKRCSQKFRQIHRKTPVSQSFFKKSCRSQACNFIKKTLQHMCFPVNLAKFLRTPFFIEHLRWLLLILQWVKSRTRMFNAFYVQLLALNKLILHFLEKIKTEAVAQKCSVKKVFLEILQN